MGCFFFFVFVLFFWPKKVYHRAFLLYMLQCFVYTYLQPNIHEQHFAGVEGASPAEGSDLLAARQAIFTYAKWLERFFEGKEKKQ